MGVKASYGVEIMSAQAWDCPCFIKNIYSKAYGHWSALNPSSPFSVLSLFLLVVQSPKKLTKK
jgi:hypothetical protein